VTLWIGTSGWQYKSWKGRFYPEDLPQKDWLDHYAQRFRTHARPLGAKLGPVLVQLPPNLPCDLGLLRHFLDVWPARHNNDPEGCAVRDAARFAELAARSGWDVTRTVDRRSVTVG
jgi:uncharacterized protein YecE (DUF72 family)